MLATVSDLVARWDQRLLADLASDTGTPESSLSTNARVLAALEGASGQVRSAVLQGQRYTVEDLANLGPEDSAYLKDIVCGLAVLRLAVCRLNVLGEQVYKDLRQDLQERLEELARGERIFATAQAQEAGLPKTDGPRLADYQRINLMVDRCGRYYPPRGQELPLGRT